MATLSRQNLFPNTPYLGRAVSTASHRETAAGIRRNRLQPLGASGKSGGIADIFYTSGEAIGQETPWVEGRFQSVATSATGKILRLLCDPLAEWSRFRLPNSLEWDCLAEMEIPDYFDSDFLRRLNEIAGSPCFVYDEATIREQVETMRNFPAPFGLFPRYAMKACPTRAIVALITGQGVGIDASSGFEVDRAIRAGVKPSAISLSTQELPEDFAHWMEKGVKMNACSLSQLRAYGKRFPGTRVGLRFNPGLGSGGTAKTNVGGPSSSFGIWHEKTGEVRSILEEFSLTAERIHTHIGSGSDPAVWQRTAQLSLALVREFETVEILNLGGGYKVARMDGETGTDLLRIGEPVAAALEAFAAETGRRIRLEIEPGTFLLANSGFLVSRVQDVVDTGPSGNRFLKLDSGMTELLRPSLYAAQHPIALIPHGNAKDRPLTDYVIVGHCCESGDLVTPSPEDAEALAFRSLPEATIGDGCVIGGAGAYCSAMSTKNYNSFPEAAEVLRTVNGGLKLIRRRQTLEQLLANEL